MGGVEKASEAFDIMGLVKNESKSVESFKVNGLIDEKITFNSEYLTEN
jgi:hypothetical protein